MDKKLRAIAGNHAIQEFLKVRPNTLREVWISAKHQSDPLVRELMALAQKKKITIGVKPDMQLEKICRTHQGAILFADQIPQLSLQNVGNGTKSIVLLLDGVEDPHNLGALIRTSWLMGVEAMLIPADRAVGLTAAVHKVACGGVEHVPLIIGNQFAQEVEILKEKGFWVFGFSHETDKTIFEWKATEKVVLCMGAEDKGLRKTTERICDDQLRLPQLSASASYNVSVAAGMALSETFRQHSLI